MGVLRGGGADVSSEIGFEFHVREASTRRVASRSRRQQLVRQGLSYLTLGAVSILALAPLWWMLATALMTNDQLFSRSIQLLPNPITLENFPHAIEQSSFPRYFVNTVILVVAVLTGT